MLRCIQKMLQDSAKDAKVSCALSVLEELIKYHEGLETHQFVPGLNTSNFGKTIGMDPEAIQAMRELTK